MVALIYNEQFMVQNGLMLVFIMVEKWLILRGNCTAQLIVNLSPLLMGFHFGGPVFFFRSVSHGH